MDAPADHPIVFYDGDCGLCDRSVRWVMHHDRRDLFRFAPLQGPTYAALAPTSAAAKPADVSTIVLLDDGDLFFRSTAALRILRRIGGPWSVLAAAASVIPRPLRDAVYRFIAANRHRWFGGREACKLPTAGEQAKLLP